MDLREYQERVSKTALFDVLTNVKELAYMLRYVARESHKRGYSLEELASLDMEAHEDHSRRS